MYVDVARDSIIPTRLDAEDDFPPGVTVVLFDVLLSVHATQQLFVVFDPRLGKDRVRRPPLGGRPQRRKLRAGGSGQRTPCGRQHSVERLAPDGGNC